MTCPKCEAQLKPGKQLVGYFKCLSCGSVFHKAAL